VNAARFFTADCIPARAPRRARRAGFTLVELLAAMSVLILIVSLCAQLFSGAQRSWRSGTGMADSAANGRAIMDYIARELQVAAADSRLRFYVTDATETAYGGNTNRQSHELYFVAMNNDNAAANREAQQVAYYIREETPTGKPRFYQLMRAVAYKTSKITAYDTLSWWNNFTQSANNDNVGVMVEDVITFRVRAYNDAGNMINSFSAAEGTNRLPAYVDIFLETIGAADAREFRNYAALKGKTHADVKDYLDKNARRFFTRVYFPNRNGYAATP